jgi:hypothetical protein
MQFESYLKHSRIHVEYQILEILQAIRTICFHVERYVHNHGVGDRTEGGAELKAVRSKVNELIDSIKRHEWTL